MDGLNLQFRLREEIFQVQWSPNNETILVINLIKKIKHKINKLVYLICDEKVLIKNLIEYKPILHLF